MAVEKLRNWQTSPSACTDRAAEFERMWCPAADPVSRRLPVVVLEQPAQPHPALDCSFARRCRPVARQQHVVLGLMRSLFVVMSLARGDDRVQLAVRRISALRIELE